MSGMRSYYGPLLEDFIGACLLRYLNTGGMSPNLMLRKDFRLGMEVFDFFVKNNNKTGPKSLFKKKDFYVEITTTRGFEERVKRISPRLDYHLFVIVFDGGFLRQEYNENITIYGLQLIEKFAELYPDLASAFHISEAYSPLGRADSYWRKPPRQWADEKAWHQIYPTPDSAKELGEKVPLFELADDDQGVVPNSDFRSEYHLVTSHDEKKKRENHESPLDASEFSLVEDMKDDIKVVMILGNGVSLDFGSASWSKLSRALSDFLVPKYSENLDKLLTLIGDSKLAETELAKAVISPDKYHEVIYQSLYGKYERDMLKSNTLLSAVGDVAHKYPEITIATYNYDEFLEMYLDERKGIKSIPVFDEDSDNNPSQYSERQIYHLHGFMKYDPAAAGHKGKGIVLTNTDYMNNYKDGKWCAKKQKKWLNANKTCVLFVGSSMTDSYQLDLILNRVRFSDKNPVYALLARNDLDDKSFESVLRYFKQMGIEPIFSKNFKSLPDDLRHIFGI